MEIKILAVRKPMQRVSLGQLTEMPADELAKITRDRTILVGLNCGSWQTYVPVPWSDTMLAHEFVAVAAANCIAAIESQDD